MKSAVRALSPLVPFFLIACAGPRSVNLTPEAAPKGQFRIESDVALHLPTNTSQALYGGLEGGIKSLYNQISGGNTVAMTVDSMNGYIEAILAYALDPLGPTPGLSLHYGVLERFDVGYRRESGANAFDIRCQFLGVPGKSGGGWKGSVALQYSSQKYEFPSFLGLNKLQDLFKLEFKRKDFLVPIAVGKEFGGGGRFGSFALGGVYDLALISYGTEYTRVIELLTNQPFQNLRGEKKVHAFGSFATVRGGYKFIYAVASLTTYWQNYGNFVFYGNETKSWSGFTFMPSLGVEFRLGGK